MSHIFLLSPANCGGIRAKQALSPRAQFALAAALRSADGAPLGELFSFVSGLYFRGKLTYACRFAQPPDPLNTIVGAGVHVITPNAGLRSPDTRVTHAAVRPARCQRSWWSTSATDAPKRLTSCAFAERTNFRFPLSEPASGKCSSKARMPT